MTRVLTFVGELALVLAGFMVLLAGSIILGAIFGAVAEGGP